MQTAGYAQLNVRMNQSLKDEGTLALKSKGYTPAAFIRGIWRRLACRGESLDTLVRLANADGDTLSGTTVPVSTSDLRKTAQTPHCHGDELWAQFLSRTSLDTEAVAMSYEELPYKELLSLARAEQFGTEYGDSAVGR